MSEKNKVSWISCSLALCVSLVVAMPSHAEGLLDKIQRTGQVTVGLREDIPPFAFYDKNKNWVGFSVDIAQRLQEALSKRFNKPIQLNRKAVDSKSRIPLVVNGEIDVEIGTTSITLSREEVVDFTLPFFITGARLIVPKGSPIKEVADLGGKKVGVAMNTTNVKILEKAVQEGLIKPKCEIVQYEDHNKGFLGLTQKKVDGYFADASILQGEQKKARNPKDWEVVGQFISYEPYGFVVPQNDSKWRDFLNAFLIQLIKSGEFSKIYEKWMGPNGEVPMPMTEAYKTYLGIISFPE